jgi:hypothetical protein
MVLLCRVARWFIFKPKIIIWEKILRALEWKMFYTYFLSIWNILLPFGIVYGDLVVLW